MSRFWPRAAYAEDQPYSRSILVTHVLTRGLQSGAVVGAVIGTSQHLLRHFQILKPRALGPSTYTNVLLRSVGVGGVVGTGLLAVGLPLMMHGKEEIEWSDRSWRLLENKGQVECDDWTYIGMGAGAVAAATRGTNLGWRGIAGSVSAGSLVGMLGYMGWRYGVKGGKFEELKEGTV